MEKMIFSAMAIGLLLSAASCQKELGYTGFVDQDAAAETQINVTTDKAVYEPGATVSFSANTMPSGAIYVRYKHLGQIVGDEQPLTGATWTWTAPSEDYKGYMTEIYQKTAEGENILATIAVDVSTDWSRFPRYGFLSSYSEMTPEACTSVIANLNRLHINGVQFQDWHWKHHWPLAQDKVSSAPLETYIDIASRETSLATIRNYISLCHQFGMKAIFYNLCFGALEDAEEDGVQEEWYLYKDANHTSRDVHTLGAPFKSSIWLVDPGNPDWLDYIGEKTDAVYEHLDFDGYQIDQLGDRGSVWDFDGNPVDLTARYGEFTDEMKSRQPEKDLIMNAVSSYGSDDILGSGNVAFAYNELWESEAQFSDFKKIIEDNMSFGGDNMKSVFAAYMNYSRADNIGTFNTPGVLLTDAVIFALGGSHLEMGEHMLGKEYFPNSNLGMDETLSNAIVVYYDFMTAYQNLLRDGGSFNDIVVTSADGTVNIRAWEPAIGSVTTLGREFADRQVVHFLNFLNADSMSWRDMNGTMPEPQLLENVAVDIALPSAKEVSSVWIASPDTDMGASRQITFTQEGTSIKVTLPSLKYWDMLVIEYE